MSVRPNNLPGDKKDYDGDNDEDYDKDEDFDGDEDCKDDEDYIEGDDVNESWKVKDAINCDEEVLQDTVSKTDMIFYQNYASVLSMTMTKTTTTTKYSIVWSFTWRAQSIEVPSVSKFPPKSFRFYQRGPRISPGHICIDQSEHFFMKKLMRFATVFLSVFESKSSSSTFLLEDFLLTACHQAS